jgi:hypothetical protein
MKNLIVAILSLTLGACASITSGTQQAVFVDTPMLNGATCKLTDSKKGSWYLPASPGSVSVQKGDGPMNVVCDKEGYVTGITSVDEEIAGATFGNIILGGGIGIFVDAATGAAQKYPDRVVVWMRPVAWKSPDDELAWNAEKRKFDEEEAAKKAAKERQNQGPGPGGK